MNVLVKISTIGGMGWTQTIQQEKYAGHKKYDRRYVLIITSTTEGMYWSQSVQQEGFSGNNQYNRRNVLVPNNMK